MIPAEYRFGSSGDHILGDITPNISLWDGYGDPLSDYLRSLEMIKDIDVAITLPGHRSVIRNHTKRIEELIEHHHIRATEVLDILEGKTMTGFEIAAEMKWELTIREFDDFPVMQKWFALGEALAHIRFLENHNRIQTMMENGMNIYSVF